MVGKFRKINLRKLRNSGAQHLCLRIVAVPLQDEVDTFGGSRIEECRLSGTYHGPCIEHLLHLL